MRARKDAGASTSAAALRDERDRPLLLGEPVGKLGGFRDSCLERGTMLRRERPVCERGQFDDLLTGVIPVDGVSWTRQHTR